MFNKVIMLGNLTRDIELRYTQGGTAIGNSAIAVTRKMTINGEKREETCFIDIAFYGKTAEIANQYLKKGSRLLIEGRLRFEQWTDNNGQNRSKHIIAVETIEMLNSNENGSNNSYSRSADQAHQNLAPKTLDEVNSEANDNKDIPF
ncbi:single-stranded DNA-binding protein [Campylobacter concisus]|uniref:single-stranded DNA-binding protein n=1 Tax=Campylobacter concisus TaxID=199 RepID=UPI000CD95E92|nr:single-stranded DNA-binding protein [Campylobacter concisus]